MKGLALKRSFLLILAVIYMLSEPSLYAQIKPVQITKIDSLQKIEAKPMLILLSTDWCQYCQMQKIQLRKNKTFIQNARLFHYVEFDATDKNEITFNNLNYVYKPTGTNVGYHELAQYLNGNGQLSFPTWVILNKNYEIIFRNKGVLLPKDIAKITEVLKQID